MSREPDVNVVGGTLLPCSTEPLTGFYRDGCCATSRRTWAAIRSARS